MKIQIKIIENLIEALLSLLFIPDKENLEDDRIFHRCFVIKARFNGEWQVKNVWNS